MRRILNARFAAVAALAVALVGCQSAPVSNVNTNAPQSAASPGPPAGANNAGANQQPVTLAVLDALFADETFAQELKTKAGLTDDQIAQLRKVAEEERGSLREPTDGEEYAGTTRAATERARQRIAQAVGQEKAQQIFAFAGERWGGGMAAGAAQPNAVPTDTRIVVNAPAFRMDLFENGQLTKTYKVGIGYPEFPLPAGMRKADTIIYNPAWIPPDEPWVEAPGSKVKVGEKVDPGSPLNPLGPVKIPIGLPSLIHGGKAPARLGQFASHGCVGLTSPQVLEFARDLAKLSGTQLSEEQVAEYTKNKKETKNVKLSNPVTVELRYETIVATNDGKLHVYRDVYDRGTNTEENLRRVLQAHGLTLEQLAEHERSQALEAVRQMAFDATGKPAEGDGVDNSNVVDKPRDNSNNANNSNSNSNGNSNGNSNSNANARNRNTRQSGQPAERVTRTVKGQREITIDIAALQGKGYPVPVNLNPPEQPGKKGNNEGGNNNGNRNRNENSTGAQRRRTS